MRKQVNDIGVKTYSEVHYGQKSNGAHAAGKVGTGDNRQQLYLLQSYTSGQARRFAEVYTNEACTSLFTSGRFRGLEGDVTVPGGTSWIKAFVRKPLYADSDVVTWQCRIVRKRIFVAPESMGGSDAGENDGSLGKPFATPQKALAAFQEGIDAHEYGADAAATSNVVLYMMLLGDIEASPSFAFATNENSFVNANLTGFDGTLRIEPREDKRVTLASVGENHRVMRVGGGKVVLNNIALTGGNAIGVAPQGGGLYVSGASSSVTLLNCEVSGNSAVDGAGVYCAAGTVSLDGSSVTGNTASSNGGGAYVEASASLKLNACQIKSNSSGVAGGGVCNQGTFSINGKNEITENTGSGGASNVYLATGTLIEVSGSIAQSKIGVTLQGAAPEIGIPVAFTHGYKANGNTEKPGKIFACDGSLAVTFNAASTEAAFALGGGGIYDATDYTISFPVGTAVATGAEPALTPTDSGKGYSFYTLKSKTFAIKPAAKRKNLLGTEETLYYNSADQKLYLDPSFAEAASDQKALLTASLHSGSALAASLAVSSAGTVTLPATLADNSVYSLKIKVVFMGITSETSVTMQASRSAKNAAAYIDSLEAPGTYKVAVDGSLGAGYAAGSEEGFALVAKAIKGKNGSGVKIDLDLSAATQGTADLTAYNGGAYFKGCQNLAAAALPDWMPYIVDSLFEGCSGLESVKLGAAAQYIGASAFKGCEALARIDLPEALSGTSSAGDLRGIAAAAFSGCSALAVVNYEATKAQFAEIERAGGWHTGVLTDSANCSDGPCSLDYTLSQSVPLTIEATQSSTTVSVTLKIGAKITYKINGGASVTFEATNASNKTKDISLEEGYTLELYGENKSYWESDSNCSKISCNNPCYIYGNIMSLVGGESGFAAATTLEEPNTFRRLFYENVKLKSKDGSPLILSATALTENCCYEMFYGCKALTSAPALPATTLANSCYFLMFAKCEALTSAPALPAPALAEDCYRRMFYNCKALTSAPEISATSLADKCCYWMFEDCKALASAPALPATELAYACYSGMFLGCEALTSAPELPATTLAEECYSGMFQGCKALTSAPILPATTLAKKCYSSMFSGCEGLASAPNLPATSMEESCYSSMFSGCKTLASAPVLAAETLAKSCYYYMFYNCAALTGAPALPATTLAESCYEGMFQGCKALTNPPILSAMTLVKKCYSSMFSGCEALASAPALPATTLVESCYSSMFSGCKALASAPELNSTALAESCYSGMFSGCASLVTAPELPATTLPNRCYYYMFRECKKLASAPAIHAVSLGERSCGNMFDTCSGLESVDADMLTPIDPTVEVTLGYHCYEAMFKDCWKLTNAPNLPAKTLVLGCYSQMFSICPELVNGPVMEATSAPDASIASDGCCYKMFYDNDMEEVSLKTMTIKLESIPENCCALMFYTKYGPLDFVITCYAQSFTESGIKNWLVNNSNNKNGRRAGKFKTPYVDVWQDKLPYDTWTIEAIDPLP